MQGHIAVILWEYYLYKPDVEYLRAKTYPILRDIALFYCSFLEKCRKDQQGKILVGPSYFPENFYFGQDNGAYDLPYVNYGLKAAREAARVLKTDEDQIQRIGAVLAQMPYYEQVPDPAQGNKPVVTYYRGVKEFPKDDRHASMVQAVFPAGQVTWFSPQEEQELFKRTINLVGKITTHANSPVTLNVSRARLGMTDEALSNIAIDFTQHHKELPNGLFSWKAHGTYISEQAGVSRMISELLLQSVGDVIRVFPAWPAARDAEFARLRAQGGFLVSARLSGGSIGDVRIGSTAGGTARIVNPWPGSAIHVIDTRTGQKVPAAETQGIAAFPTQPGGSYRLSP
jgi:alpha-L-fucosidase 2